MPDVLDLGGLGALQNPNQKNSQKKKAAGCQSVQLPPSHPVQWTGVLQEILNMIINQLTNPPVIAYLDQKKPLEEGLGTVLYRRQDRVLRVSLQVQNIDSGQETISYILASWNSWHLNVP